LTADERTGGFGPNGSKHYQAITELKERRKYGLFAGEFYHEIAAQILLVSLRQARRNEHFCFLSRSIQDCILRHVWNELFLLHAAYWPIDVSALIRRALNNGQMHQHCTKTTTSTTSKLLRRSLELCQNLQLDAVELSLLETLILCRKGKNEHNLTN
jgi:nuclear receptor